MGTRNKILRRFSGVNEINAGTSEYMNANFDDILRRRRKTLRTRAFADNQVVREDTIPLSKDTSIISGIDGKPAPGRRQSNNGSLNPSAPLVVERDDFIQGWSDNPFYFSVDPWVSSPIMSDTKDGIYVGTLSGDKVEYKEGEIRIGVSVSTSYPTPVVVIIKGKKAHVFKQTQLTEQVNRTFSAGDIENDQQFRSYAHNIMMQAHGDDYSEKETNKVVDGILRDHKRGNNYGELIGILKKSLAGDRRFSDEDGGSSSPIVPQDQMQQMQQMQDQAGPQGPVQPDMMGGDPQQQGMPEEMSPDQMPQPSPYNFAFNVVNNVPSMDTLIGTLAYAPAICNLYQIFSSDYTDHLVLKEFYDKLPEQVYKLASVYLKDNPQARFESIVNPEGMDPQNYLSNLLELCSSVKATQENSMYGSIIDEIATDIQGTIFKLQRVSEGKKLFSIKTFSDQSLMKEISSSAEEAAVQKFNNGEQPIPDEHFKTSREVRVYVRNKSRNIFDFKQLLEDLMGAGEKSVQSGMKEYLKIGIKGSGSNNNNQNQNQKSGDNK